jgi:hypothetical protein
MTTLNGRLNNNSNETYLGTGIEANQGRKVNTLETYWVNTIPVDRHRFSIFAGYLVKFSKQLTQLASESCKRDCNRKLKYTHGKNMTVSDDLFTLCSSRCENEIQYFKDDYEVYF